MKTALIVVDVQKFFMHDAPDELPGNIARHITTSQYDTIAFTVFRNQPDSNFVKSLKWEKCSAVEDTELPPEFTPFITSHNTFERATFSGFITTKLDEFLRNAQIEKVVICGVDTDACVLATGFSAFDSGYLVDVNTELTFSDGGLENEAQAIIKRSLLARK